ncbi:serine hydrolase domain-containing protein [Marinigracilibium pacificum]|uniref:Beta-lactamase family protein n=1 Tax=Marinigracilibium pacificum TaxID=2729599 RepID=A0A848J199_9BACT|nr:serine hydrolase domain-containing protein [Marinigracilibium pacificum]NMM48320.1 beta-lactamase family protein [Marinigracilibium pacificum]
MFKIGLRISALSVLFFALSCSEIQNDNNESGSTSSKNDDSGVIYAKPENVASNIPYEEVARISTFFNQPENKVKIQFPSAETEYAWQHWSQFYPTAPLYRSGQVSELPYNIHPEIGELSFVGRDGKTETVDYHFENFPVDAMVIVKGGEIVYERYNTMRPDDKHIWFSSSKVTGATMLAFLELEGKVDVQKPVTYYLEELKGSDWETVKVVEALDMATGLNGTEHDEPNHDPRTNPKQIWFRWAATSDVAMLPGDISKNWYDILGEMKRVKPAYEAFEYNSINTFVINRIVEKVGGKSLHEQLSERIWSKMGMEHDADLQVSPSGKTLGFIGMNTSVRDMARFGMAFTPSGTKLAGEQIIPNAIIKKIQDTSHSDMYATAFARKKFAASFPDVEGLANRYQWDVVIPNGDFFKSGVGGQGLFVSPSNDAVAAWFCTGDGSNQEETMVREIIYSLAGN